MSSSEEANQLFLKLISNGKVAKIKKLIRNEFFDVNRTITQENFEQPFFEIQLSKCCTPMGWALQNRRPDVANVFNINYHINLLST